MTTWNIFIIRAPYTSYNQMIRYSSWLAEFQFTVDQGYFSFLFWRTKFNRIRSCFF